MQISLRQGCCPASRNTHQFRILWRHLPHPLPAPRLAILPHYRQETQAAPGPFYAALELRQSKGPLLIGGLSPVNVESCPL